VRDDPLALGALADMRADLCTARFDGGGSRDVVGGGTDGVELAGLGSCGGAHVSIVTDHPTGQVSAAG